MKKLISYIVLVAMTVSLFAGFTVFAAEDITSDPMEFAINNTTISASSSCDLYTWAVTVHVGGYIEYIVNTETEGYYKLLPKVNTSQNVHLMDVTVNGTLVNNDTAIENTAGADKFVELPGAIKLTAGANTIRFTNASPQGSVNYIIMKAFQLKSCVEDITSDPVSFKINKNTIHATDTNSGDLWDWAVTLTGGKYFEYKITTQTAAEYKLTLTSATLAAGNTLDVAVNGETKITGVSVPSANSTTWTDASYVAGLISLGVGENIIRVTASSKLYSSFSGFTLERISEDINSDPMEFKVNQDTISAYEKCDRYTWAITVHVGGYIEYIVNTKTDGYYKLSPKVNTSLDGLLMDVTVNGELVNDNAAIANTAGADAFVELPGAIHLEMGKNVIRFANASANGSANYIVMKGFQLEKCVEDITSNPMDFAVNVNTIGNTTIGSGEQFGWAVTLAYGTYFDYEVTTQTPGDYKLTVGVGTLKDGTSLDILVNETEVLSDVAIPNNGSYDSTPLVLGVISLKAGTNVIRFQSSSNCYASVNKFTLERIIEDITEDPMTFAVNKDTIGTTNIASGDLWSYAVTIGGTNYFEYEINTKTPAYYKVSIRSCSDRDGGKLDVYVNGTEQIADAEIKNTGGFATPEIYDIGLITLEMGKNTLKFQGNTGSYFNISQIILEKVIEDITSDPMTFGVNVDTIGETNIASGDLWSYAVTIGGTNYFEYEINTAATATYKLSIRSCSDRDTSKLDVYVNDVEQLADAAIKNTGGFATPQIYAVGVITLDMGKNILKFQGNTGSYFNMSQIILEKVTEDITAIPASFVVNKNTVSSTTAGTNDQYDYAITIHNDKYFEYKIVTKTAKKYKLSVRTAATADGSKIDVYVNGNKQINAAPVTNNGSYSSTVTYSLGNITLDVGTNTLKFHCPTGGGVVFYEFILDYVTEEITSDPVEFDVNVNTISATDAADSNVTSAYATVLTGRYIEYQIATETTGNYTLTVDAATKAAGGLVDVFVNGQRQVNDAEITNNGTYDTYAANELGAITLTPGTNTIKIFGEYANTIRINKLTLSTDNATDIRFTGFELQIENGARPPYVVKEDLDVYAVAEFERIADSESDNLYLFVAQYTDKGALVDATYVPVDLANLALYEPEQFKTKITLKGETGSVKAYLMKEKDFSPVAEKIGYSEVTIFDDSFLDEVFNETPVYTPASEVTDINGNYYTGYDDGNIKAIFYDSEVGDQTMVFAYVGVPSGATEANPVPAIVLVHGGAGIAYKEWVKKWNDKGVAAIAMSLAGDGPDATGADTAHHPYRGIDCWGEPIAFKADLENASMYQNALNVIRAHNLIRSLDGVDETRTAITGISWGGITTTMMTGIDNRFKFAIPCYGSGYLDQSRTYFKAAYTGSDRSAAWDPANFAAQTEMPVLYVNGDSDEHFSLNITTLSHDVTDNAKLSIHHGLTHGYQQIWTLNMIYDYALDMFDGVDPTITISNAKAENGTLTASYTAPSGTTASSATMYYITTDNLGFGGEVEWTSVAGTISGSTISADIPADATYCYASIVDSNGLTVSTRLLEVK